MQSWNGGSVVLDVGQTAFEEGETEGGRLWEHVSDGAWGRLTLASSKWRRYHLWV